MSKTKTNPLLLSLGLIVAAAVLFTWSNRLSGQGTGVFSPGAIPPASGSVTTTMSTWANAPTGHVNLALSPQKFTMTSDCSVTGFDNAAAAGNENSCILWLTNSASSNCTIRITASGYTDVGTGARSYVVTNGSQAVIAFNKNDLGFHGQENPSF